jgi:putative membrane protein
MVMATVVQGISDHHDDDMGGGWWWVMGIGWLVFLAAIVIVVVVLVRHFQTQASPRRSSAHDVLDERFARGEIDVEEYRRRRDALRG